MTKLFDLQLFATGDNNDLPVRTFTKEYKEMLQAVFKKRSYFADFFGGGIEALDGVKDNQTAFSVKTCDIAVAVGDGYTTTGTTAFGTGTGSGSRFGDRTEIIYSNVDVNYTWNYNWHEGIDRYTVNNDFDAAIADRIELQAQAKVHKFNQKHGKFISDNAEETKTLASYTDANVLALFDDLDEYFTNKETVGERKAKVCPKLYNAIVNMGIVTNGKGSAVNIDTNGIVQFKGFQIEKIPSNLFQTNEICYAYIAGVAKAFTGIITARTIESEDFDGVAFQGAGKAGEYILPDNKAAVVKVTLTSA